MSQSWCLVVVKLSTQAAKTWPKYLTLDDKKTGLLDLGSQSKILMKVVAAEVLTVH